MLWIAYEEGLRELREAGRQIELWPGMDQPCGPAPWDLC